MDDRTARTVAIIAALTTVVATASAIITFRQGSQSRQRNEALQAEILALNTELANRSAKVTTVPPPAETIEKAVPNEPPAHADDTAITERDAEIVRLNARVAELETAAAERESRRQSMAERMKQRAERMKAQNPEEYERRKKEGQERLDSMAQLTHDRLEFMKSIPVEGLAPEYLQNHLAVLERLEFFNSAMSRMAANPDGDTMRELMPQVFMNLRGMDEMLAMQREVLLSDLARDLGYEEQRTSEFVSAVNYITEATTLPSPGFMRGRGRSQGRQAGETGN